MLIKGGKPSLRKNYKETDRICLYVISINSEKNLWELKTALSAYKKKEKKLLDSFQAALRTGKGFCG